MGNTGNCVDVGASVEFDRIADALAHSERRQVLVGLLDHNPLDYREAIVGDAAAERDGATIRMIHMHLPKLEDMGFISWNSDSGTVVKGDQWNEIEPTLRLLSDNREQLPADVF